MHFIRLKDTAILNEQTSLLPTITVVSFICEQVIELIYTHLRSVDGKILQQSRAFEPTVGDYISYITSKSGKRLRPILVLLSGGSAGKITSEHIDLAVILELIHIATLVHDDIMDGADFRHEQATANTKWGNSLSVLLGDCLFSHALRLATSFSSQEISRKIADASTEVCSGEILQTQHRFDLKLSISDYHRIIQMKTAALFSLACELGSLVSGASTKTIVALRRFGRQFGIAYQIYDDCLDFVGNEIKIGKTLGTDLKRGKFTLPVLLMLRSKKFDHANRKVRISSILGNGKGIVDTNVVTRMVRKSGAMQAASQTGIRLINEAKNNLLIVPENPYVLALGAMAKQLEFMLQLL